MKKRVISVLSAVTVIASLIPSAVVSAYDLPSAFWIVNEKYLSAVDEKNYSDTAKYGSEIVNMILSEEKNDQTVDIIGSRAYETAFAYFFLGDYDNALKYFQLYIPYGKEKNWTDGVIIAENFIKQLTTEFDVYKHTSAEQKYFGAKNEPHGVLYGQVSECSQRNESMVLLYLEYGNFDEFNWARAVFDIASRENKSVELALNFPNQGDTARSIDASSPYLAKLAEFLGRYPYIPVYLRIGAEVNIWSVSPCSPDDFKKAYRTIASKFKAIPNIATVWSIAHTSQWKSDSWPYTTNDFYPGDEYVDWVGATVYTNKYFGAKHWDGVSYFNEVCFKTGLNSDPVLMIKDLADTYGDRKPIMVSECGSSYRSQGEINETHHEWGAERLTQIFSFIPMVYPQVKLMAYFNKRMGSEANLYNFAGSPALEASYKAVTSKPWFIQNSTDNSAESYFEKLGSTLNTDGSVRLSSYPHIYGAESVTVDYYIDGNLAVSSSTVPYTVDISGISGTHTLRVTARGSNGRTAEKSFSLNSTTKTNTHCDFSDTSQLLSVQKSALDYAVKNGIMTGYTDGTIKPMNTITRAEFATMICRMMKYTVSEPCGFSDAASHWGSSYIKACTDTGAINGVGDNKFDPDGTITFEQGVKILTVVCGIADSSAAYPDGFITAADKNGIIENLTSRAVGKPLNRIDAAVMMEQAAANTH